METMERVAASRAGLDSLAAGSDMTASSCPARSRRKAVTPDPPSPRKMQAGYFAIPPKYEVFGGEDGCI